MRTTSDRHLHGLLSDLHPTGTPHSILATDGGGVGKPRNLLLAEALRTSAAGLQRASDWAVHDGKPDDIRRKNKPATDKERIGRWEPSVRIEVVRGRLMADLYVEKGELKSRNLGSLLKLSDPLDIEEDDEISAAESKKAKWLLKEEARHVLRRAAQREERQAEIESQVDELWAFFAALTHLEPSEAPRTYELLRMAQAVATNVVMQIKHDFACPRPSDVLPAIAPAIAVPGHASFPSGHATSAHLLSELLIRLLGCPMEDVSGVRPGQLLLTKQLRRLAFRIARNREIAGLHFGIDSLAGQMLGGVLADYIASRAALTTSEVTSAALSLDKISKRSELLELARRSDEHSLKDLATLGPKDLVTIAKTAQTPSDPLLQVMWSAADDELKAIGLRF